MNDYLIICDKGIVKKQIFEKFYKIMVDDNQLDHASYITSSIYLIDGSRYRFILRSCKDQFTRGFRGHVIESSTFEHMIDIFTKSIEDGNKCTLNRIYEANIGTSK